MRRVPLEEIAEESQLLLTRMRNPPAYDLKNIKSSLIEDRVEDLVSEFNSATRLSWLSDWPVALAELRLDVERGIAATAMHDTEHSVLSRDQVQVLYGIMGKAFSSWRALMASVGPEGVMSTTHRVDVQSAYAAHDRFLKFLDQKHQEFQATVDTIDETPVTPEIDKSKNRYIHGDFTYMGDFRRVRDGKILSVYQMLADGYVNRSGCPSPWVMVERTNFVGLDDLGFVAVLLYETSNYEYVGTS